MIKSILVFSLLFTVSLYGANTKSGIRNYTATTITSPASNSLSLRGTTLLNLQTYDSGWQTRLTIANGGNVGIGMTPTHKLNPYVSSMTVGTDTTYPFYARVADTGNWGGVAIGYDTTNDIGIIQSVKTGSTWKNLQLNPNGGNVGIGTTNPQVPLEIMRDASSSNALYLTDTRAFGSQPSQAVAFRGYSAGSTYTVFGNVSGGKENATESNTAGYIAIATRPDGGTPTERVRIASDGKVGIGTQTPGRNLDVYQDLDNFITFRVNNPNAGSSASARMQFGNNANSSISYLQQNSNANTTLGGVNSLNIVSVAGDFTINTGGTNERMRITSGGDIGIGTNNPLAKLHLYNTTNDGSIRLESTGGTASAWIIQSSGGYSTAGLAFYSVTAGAYRMFMDGSGNLAIGTGVTAPTAKLDVSGDILTSSGIYIGSKVSDKLIDDASNGSSSTTLYIGNQSITTSSDKRLKKNIVDSKLNALDKIKKMRIVDFEWDDPSDIGPNNRNARGKWTGVIAQEVVKVFPTMVNAPRDENGLIDNNSKDTWLVDHSATVPLLLKAIQEQQAQIEQLKSEIIGLKNAR